VSKLVIVGELNPYGQDPRFALYHLPRHASGNRLREHLGLSDVEYEKIAKVNLCYGKWSMNAARETVKLINSRFDVAVLLGAKVRDAFNGPEFYQVDIMEEGRAIALVTLPHPSGLNRMWNEPGARERARAVMRVVAPQLPWGSA
jgi:hypothetical protein